ncbi:MAG: hypothetical protein LC660_15230 [Desulfobacteraceae bacterium]|nr:hypothetical protein [Desulfobacteraceae bacterium]
MKGIPIKDGSEQKNRSYLGTINVNEANMSEAGKLDGFWLLVTNHTEKDGKSFKVSPESAIDPYREKVVIESAFRDIKSYRKTKRAARKDWQEGYTCA